MFLITIIATLVLAVLFGCFIKNYFSKNVNDEEGDDEKETKEKKTTKNGTSHVESSKKTAKVDHRKKPQANFTHPWLATNLKGHSGQILGIFYVGYLSSSIV